MKSFFQIAIILTFIIFLFTVVASFISSTGTFPFTEELGIAIDDDTDFFTKLTGLESGSNMHTIFLGVTGLTFIGAVALAFATKSVVPIGLHLFGVVFWTSFTKTKVILDYGGYISPELQFVFTIAVTFVFIAAIVGILTGSG